MTELHVRLDGAMRPKTCTSIFEKQGRDILYIEKFRDPDHAFIKRRDEDSDIDYAVKALQTEDGIERTTFEVLNDFEEKGTEYIELCYAPALSTLFGLTQRQVVDSIISGIARYQMGSKKPMEVGLILSLLRGEYDSYNYETVELLREYKGTPVCGIDLIGDQESPLSHYADMFRMAKEYGYPLEIDVEGGGKEAVKLALDLGADRIINAEVIYDDEALMERIKQAGILLEFSISGKYLNNKVDIISSIPLKTILRFGLRCCFITDCATFYRTDVSAEAFNARAYLDLSYLDCMKMEKSAEEGRFLRKKAYRPEL